MVPPTKSGKKTAALPYPQGKAGAGKKAAKIANLLSTEPPYREAHSQLRYRPGHPAPSQPLPLRQVARVCPSSAPEEDPEHAPEGSPSIAQFQATLDRNTAAQTFKLLSKYRPETKAEKKERLVQEATAVSEGKKKEDVSKKPYNVKYGLNHVVGLVENKKASLVLIAHDVDPIELVVFLPALCRKMGVPYAIVKGKARLGTVVHKKTSAVLALTETRAEDKAEFAKLLSAIKEGYTDKNEDSRRHWGGGIMGAKANARIEKKQKALDAAIKV
ncbi:Ribosomal protein L7A/L8 [Penicillium expansum]|nr:Ribosomal protein L7A/L8 [Penicillium expansum]